jgi:predicted DNA-binding protein (UPF0251 family)
MTHEEFDQYRLKCKLTFREAEAARQVLVNNMQRTESAQLMGVDLRRLEEVLKLFE